jgi:predicted PurR-regulated permease PerM
VGPVTDEGHDPQQGDHGGRRFGRVGDMTWRRRLTPSRRTRHDNRDHDEEEGLVDRVAERLTQQWAQARAERRAEVPEIVAGQSNFSRAQVPWGLDLAAAWSWRLIVITVATLAMLWTLRFFAVFTVPIAIALLLAALAAPMVSGLRRIGLRGSLSALITMVLGIAFVALMLTYVGQQVVQGASDMADSMVEGLQRIRDWLREGPLAITESQLDKAIKDVQRTITENATSEALIARATALGAILGQIVAGFFIVLFATYFFMADGARIWAWIVRLAPRAAREHVDTSGRVAWISLTQFVRATVIIALADAIGIMLVAWFLGVPFVMAIGVLVFLGAFVPMIGATIAGSVAVLVALVDGGPWTALLMLAGVIAVQQIEGHLLQPFLMGRFVSVHPLGVIVAIAAGVIVAGIAGALIAVPLAAAINAVVQHLARHTQVGEDEAHERLAAEQRQDGGHAVRDLSRDEVVDHHDRLGLRSEDADEPSGE